MKIGKLRQDEDCHWYLVPDDKIGRFDEISVMMQVPTLTEEVFDKYEDEFINLFDQYMLGGGIGNLDVIIPA